VGLVARCGSCAGLLAVPGGSGGQLRVGAEEAAWAAPALPEHAELRQCTSCCIGTGCALHGSRKEGLSAAVIIGDEPAHVI
jgi:hypothetical protein